MESLVLDNQNYRRGTSTDPEPSDDEGAWTRATQALAEYLEGSQALAHMQLDSLGLSAEPAARVAAAVLAGNLRTLGSRGYGTIPVARLRADEVGKLAATGQNYGPLEGLVCALATSTSLTSLDLSNNNLCGIDWRGPCGTYTAQVSWRTLPWRMHAPFTPRPPAPSLSAALSIRPIRMPNLGVACSQVAHALAAALTTNRTLTKLSLCMVALCGICGKFGAYTSEGVDALAAAIRGNSTLTALSVAGNCINDEGAIALAGALAAHMDEAPALELSLDFNRLHSAEVTWQAVERSLSVPDSTVSVSSTLARRTKNKTQKKTRAPTECGWGAPADAPAPQDSGGWGQAGGSSQPSAAGPPGSSSPPADDPAAPSPAASARRAAVPPPPAAQAWGAPPPAAAAPTRDYRSHS